MRAIEFVRVLSIGAAFVATASAGGAGLQVDPDTVAWPGWQVRLQLSAGTASSAKFENTLVPRSASLMGDYVVARPRLGGAGAVRVTSGVLVGPREGLFDPLSQTVAVVSNGRSSLLALRRSTAGALIATEAGADSIVARPYLGVGYSAANSRAGWGFSAELGLAAQNPSAIRLGRVVSGQNLDDQLRDLRLQPVLQLGVNYAF